MTQTTVLTCRRLPRYSVNAILMLATAGLSLAATAAPQGAHADSDAAAGIQLAQAEAERTVALDLPARPLDAALTALADQAELQLLFDSSQVPDQQAPALRGEYTPREALRRLLEGSGLTYRFTGADTVTLTAAQRADEPTHLAPIMVESDRTGAYAVEQQRLEALDNNIVLDGERIRRNPDEHIGKAVNRAPGVFATSPNDKEEIRIRGLDKQFTRISVAGVELPVTDRRRTFQVGKIGSALAGEVQVIRNPTADVQSDGIGGRVNVEFREIPETLSGGAYTIGDVFDEDLVGGRGGAYAGGPLNENWSLLGGLDVRFEPDRRPFENRVTNPDGSFKESEIREDRTDRVFVTSLLRLRWQGAAGTAELQPMLFLDQKTKTDQRDKLKDNGDEDNRFKTEDSRNVTGGAKLSWNHGLMPKQWSWNSYVSAFVADLDAENSEIRQRTGKDAENTFSEPELQDETYELESRLAREWPSALPGRTEVGVWARSRDRDAEANNFKDGEAEDPGTGDRFTLEEDQLAGWLRHELRLLDGRFKVEPGLRVEHYDLEVDTIADDGSPRSDDNDDLHIGPSLHLAYRPVESLRLNAAVSRTLNRPQFDQIIPFDEDPKNGEIKRGNTALDPATSTNIDLGALWAIPEGSFGVTLFYKDIDDLIVETDTGEVEDGDRVIRPQNAQGGELRGIELEQRVDLGRITGGRWMRGLSLWANQTVFDGEVTLVSGKEVPFFGEPDYLLRAGINYVNSASGLDVALSLTRNGDRIEEDDNTRKVFEPETTLDLAISYAFAKRGSIRFEAVNLLGDVTEEGDKEFFDGNGNLEKIERRTVDIERSFSLGLRWEF